MSFTNHDNRYSKEDKEEETLTIMLMADCGWMDANTFYTTSSRTRAPHRDDIAPVLPAGPNQI